MSLALLAAILAFVCMGTANFAGPFLSRQAPVLSVLAVGTLPAVVLLGLFAALFAGPMPGIGFLLLAMAAGAITSASSALAFRAGQIGHIGLVSVIVSLSAIIPVAAGIFEGDKPPLVQWIGITLAACGTALTLLAGDTFRVSGDGERRKVKSNWPLLAAVGAVGYGFSLVILAGQVEENLLWAVFLNRGGLMLSAALAIPLLGQTLLRPGGSFRQLAPLPLLGLTMTTAIMLYGYASRSIMTIASALTAFTPLVSVTLSWLIVKERLTPLQIAGIAMAICGLGLLAL